MPNNMHQLADQIRNESLTLLALGVLKQCRGNRHQAKAMIARARRIVDDLNIRCFDIDCEDPDCPGC